MVTIRVRLLCFCLALFIPPLPASASEVRMLRLSLVQGDVQIDRNAGDGWEQAIVNMPVIAGARIYAADNSKAELEFEDGSNVRLAGPAQITLLQLASAPDGSPVNAIQVDSGMVYVNALLRHHDDFRISAYTGESFAITKPSHLRFTVNEQTASLALGDGEAVAKAAPSNAIIRAGETYNYILGQPLSAARLDTVPSQPDDAWDQQRQSYNEQNASAGAQYSGSDDANAPGVADLGYYGSYSDLPGYGESWQPNDVGPDWDPFDNGAWCDYPDWGWTFVSAYPWGWAPFYYGNWFHVHGRGWWWHPGPWHGSGGWHSRPLLAGAPHGFNAPHPPAGAAHGTVAVAGSNLRVGPIGVTHASALAGGGIASRSQANTSATAPAGLRAGLGAGLRSGLRTEATSAPVHPASPSVSPAGSHSPGSHSEAQSITGQKGSYVLHSGNQLHRPPGSVSVPPSVSASHRILYNSYARSYAGGWASNTVPNTYAPSTYAPHTYSAPMAARAPSAAYAPHVASGGGSVSHGGGTGGGFHGGGGGGGSHGGGGRR